MNAGIQIGVVISHKFETSQKGTPFLGVVFDVDGENMPARIFLTAKSMGIARKSLKAMGFDPDMQSVEELNKDQQLLAGARVQLDIQEEEYNGETRLVVKWINPISGPVDQSLFAKLDAGLRAAKKQKKDDLDNADPLLPEQESDVPF